MTRIYTAQWVVPAGAPAIEGGALLDVAGRIAAVGPLDEVRHSAPAAEVEDFGEALLAPLLVNAHTHLELTAFPEWSNAAEQGAEPRNFVDWILFLIQVKRGVALKQFAASLARGIRQSLAAGTGAVGDVCAHHDCRTEYRDGDLLGVLFLETLGQEPELILRAERRLSRVLRTPWPGPIALGLSPHSPYSISPSYMERVYRRCRRRGLRCATHLAESVAEVEFLSTGRGELALRLFPEVGWGGFLPPVARRSPVTYLEERGGLFPENLLVHGVQLTVPEIETLAERRMSVALCPRSNARLDVGKAPAGRLQKAGVCLALGTDSRASCDNLSVWEELAFAHTWFEGELDAPTLFEMATLGGARALGVEREFGSLTVGKQSSFQVLRPAHLPRAGELAEFLVAPGRAADISRVVVRGHGI